jgi:ABC-type lipoprotein export system ATPase subunit
MVFQSFHLLPGLTAGENIALPLLLNGVAGKAVRTRVAECLEAVDMRHREPHKPSELSGGEQQRVAIARALVHRPQLILADEPTGNLDSRNGVEIIALLRSLPQRFGQTVLLATHSQEAAQQADRIHAMKDGELQ